MRALIATAVTVALTLSLVASASPRLCAHAMPAVGMPTIGMSGHAMAGAMTADPAVSHAGHGAAGHGHAVESEAAVAMTCDPGCAAVCDAQTPAAAAVVALQTDTAMPTAWQHTSQSAWVAGPPPRGPLRPPRAA